MSGDRLEKAKAIALELLAGYSQVSSKMIEANIRMHLISIATGNKIEMKDWDAAELRAERGYNEKMGDVYKVSFKFSNIGGGTDLVGMINQFQGQVKDIKDNTIGEIVKGRNALNPSIMILYITDFGDNNHDVDGMTSATKGFGTFAEEYRADSRTVNYLSNDAGIATLFICPDIGNDDNEIANAVEKTTDGAVVNFTGKNEKDVLEKMEALKPILEGLKASNVKTEVKAEKK
jgi:hypothetical protein